MKAEKNEEACVLDMTRTKSFKDAMKGQGVKASLTLNLTLMRGRWCWGVVPQGVCDPLLTPTLRGSQVKKKGGIGVLMKQATRNFDPKNREQAILAMVRAKKLRNPPIHPPPSVPPALPHSRPPRKQQSPPCIAAPVDDRIPRQTESLKEPENCGNSVRFQVLETLVKTMDDDEASVREGKAAASA
jgi:hypothetical protein